MLEYSYIHSLSSGGAWAIANAFVAKVRLSFRPVAFQNWPAIGVQPVNITNNSYDPVFPNIGAFYIGLNMQGCQIINPEIPPPSPVTRKSRSRRRTGTWGIGTGQGNDTDLRHRCAAAVFQLRPEVHRVRQVSDQREQPQWRGREQVPIGGQGGPWRDGALCAEPGGRRRAGGVAQREWAAADAGQERQDVPDAHVQGMGRRRS